MYSSGDQNNVIYFSEKVLWIGPTYNLHNWQLCTKKGALGEVLPVLDLLKHWNSHHR